MHCILLLCLFRLLYLSFFPDFNLFRREQVDYLVTLFSSLCISCLGGQTGPVHHLLPFSKTSQFLSLSLEA